MGKTQLRSLDHGITDLFRKSKTSISFRATDKSEIVATVIVEQ